MEHVLTLIKSLQDRWEKVSKQFDLDLLRRQIRELEARSLHPDFWSNPNEARSTMREMTELQNELKDLEGLSQHLSELKLLASEASHEEKDSGINFTEEIKKLEREVDRFEIRLFLSNPYDAGDAIISVHAGQGGVEAMDWAAMILRMYLRYFERQGWSVEILNESKGEEAGIKSVTIHVKGRYAYGLIKQEAGTHRLVRQSPFNADKLRQTSFALVEVLPVLEESHVSIKPDDIKMDTFRSSGAGGQNVQKVNSAVRLTHLPTGLTASVQTERSQNQNKEYALRILRGKIWEWQEAKRRGEIASLKGEYRPASWGNQIRSYVLHPYQMVKDLRSGFETSDTEAILNGELEGLIEAGLRSG